MADRARVRASTGADRPARRRARVRLARRPAVRGPASDAAGRPAGRYATTKVVVRERWTGRAPGDERACCVIVTGVVDADTSARVDGFADNLEAAGVPVVVARVGTSARDLPASAHDAAVVLLAGVSGGPDIDALVGERQDAGRPTVLDVGADAAGRRRRAGAGLTPAADRTRPAVRPRGRAGRRSPRCDRCGRRRARCCSRRCRPVSGSRRCATRARCRASGTGLVIGWRLGAGVPYADAVGGGHREHPHEAARPRRGRRRRGARAGRTARARAGDGAPGVGVHAGSARGLGGPRVDAAARWAAHCSTTPACSRRRAWRASPRSFPPPRPPGSTGSSRRSCRCKSPDEAEEWTNALAPRARRSRRADAARCGGAAPGRHRRRSGRGAGGGRPVHGLGGVPHRAWPGADRRPGHSRTDGAAVEGRRS